MKNNIDINWRQLETFIRFAFHRLSLKSLPKIIFDANVAVIARKHTFGQYFPKRKTIVLSIVNRHPNDILRSLAHELIHHHQHESGVGAGDNTAGNASENQANSLAGVIMREFNERYPKLFVND